MFRRPVCMAWTLRMQELIRRLLQHFGYLIAFVEKNLNLGCAKRLEKN